MHGSQLRGLLKFPHFRFNIACGPRASVYTESIQSGITNYDCRCKYSAFANSCPLQTDTCLFFNYS